MNDARKSREYQPTESKYKEGAREMYVTYDLNQETRGNGSAKYPKVKRVYIAGDVTNWEVGNFEKQSGKKAYGVKIEYEQKREGYERAGYTAKRSDTGTEYEVEPAEVGESASRFYQIVEIPEDAENIQFREKGLPNKYQDALQDVR